MKFDYVSKFIDQKTEMQAGFEELVRREASALEEVHAFKAEYAKVIRESLAAGKDSTKELDVLQDKIDVAQKAFTRRQQERAMYHTVIKGKVTEQDVIDAWNTDYQPSFKQQRIDPALERLLVAKSEFVDAFLSYTDLLAEFDDQKRYAYNTIGDAHQYKFNGVRFGLRHQSEAHFITDGTIYDLEHTKVPSDVIKMIQYKKGAGIPITETDVKLATRAAQHSPKESSYVALAQSLAGKEVKS